MPMLANNTTAGKSSLQESNDTTTKTTNMLAGLGSSRQRNNIGDDLRRGATTGGGGSNSVMQQYQKFKICGKPNHIINTESKIKDINVHNMPEVLKANKNIFTEPDECQSPGPYCNLELAGETKQMMSMIQGINQAT